MASHYKPTALVVYLDASSSDKKDIQCIRCDLSISLRLMAQLEGPVFDMRFFKERLSDEDGVVRYREYQDWYNPGGTGEQELGTQLIQDLLER